MEKLILSYFLVFALALLMITIVVGTDLANWLIAPLSLVVASASWAMIKGLAAVKGPLPTQVARVRAIRSSMAALEAMVFASLASAFPTLVHSVMKYKEIAFNRALNTYGISNVTADAYLLAMAIAIAFLCTSIVFSYTLIRFQEKLDDLDFEENKLLREIGENA